MCYAEWICTRNHEKIRQFSLLHKSTQLNTVWVRMCPTQPLVRHKNHMHLVFFVERKIIALHNNFLFCELLKGNHACSRSVKFVKKLRNMDHKHGEITSTCRAQSFDVGLVPRNLMSDHGTIFWMYFCSRWRKPRLYTFHFNSQWWSSSCCNYIFF